MRLNGWQRLWVIASVLWVLFIAAVVANEFPTKHLIDKQLEWSMEQYGKPSKSFRLAPGLPVDSSETAEEKAIRESRLEDAYIKYDTDVKQLGASQTKSILIGAGVAIGLPIAFYLFCWLGVVLFRWVKAGFTRTGQ